MSEIQVDADRWQGILRVVTYALTSHGGVMLKKPPERGSADLLVEVTQLDRHASRS